MKRILSLLDSVSSETPMNLPVPENEMAMANLILAVPFLLAIYAVSCLLFEVLPVRKVAWVLIAFAVQIGREGERRWKNKLN